MVDTKNVVKDSEEVVVINEDSTLNAVSQSIESNTDLAKQAMGDVREVQTLSIERERELLEQISELKVSLEKKDATINNLRENSDKVTIYTQSEGVYGPDLRVDVTADLEEVKEIIDNAYRDKVRKLESKVQDLIDDKTELKQVVKSIEKVHRAYVNQLTADHKRLVDSYKQDLLDEEEKRERIIEKHRQEFKHERANLEMAQREERQHHNLELKKLLLDFNNKLSSIKLGLLGRLSGLHKTLKDFKYDLNHKRWNYLTAI